MFFLKQKKFLTKSTVIMGLSLWLLIFVIVAKCTSYFNAYRHKGSGYAFEVMQEELLTNPLNFPASPGIQCLAVMGIITLFMLLYVALLFTKSKADIHVKQGTEEGTSKWLTNLAKWNKTYSDPGGEPTKDGAMNTIMTKEIYLSMNTRQTQRNLNTLVIGGSGAGKSRFFVKPNLCEMPLNCNFVCTDPSGELLLSTGKMLEGAGFKIKVFDLVDMDLSYQYNPLKYINNENDVILLVDCILANTTDPHKTGGDDFWEKAQKLMFQAFIFFIWLHGDEFHLAKNMNTVMRLMSGCQISEEESTEQGGETSKYFESLETLGWYFDENDVFHAGKPTDTSKGYIYHEPLSASGKDRDDISLKQWHKFMTGAGKTLKSILISAMARLSTLDSNIVAELLNDDTIELDKMGDEKTALFVILPQEHDSFNFLAAMLYTQLFQTLYFHAEKECQGNYIVVDSKGENLRIFELDRTIKAEEVKYNEDEVVVDFTHMSEEEMLNLVNFNVTVEHSKDNVPDDDPGAANERLEKVSNAYAKHAEQNVECVQKGDKFIVRIPPVSDKEEPFIVGIYGNPLFAKQRVEAIKAGCKVVRCGLYLPYHVRFLLDEFANIGRIPEFTKKLATCRKYSISASIILQSIDQIKTIYKDDWGTIIGNCDSFLFLGCQEINTLEYVNKLLGKTTQRKRNESVSKGGKGSSSLSYQWSGRDLMTVDELRRMDNLECIYVLRGEYPYKGLKHPFNTHKNYRFTEDADPANAYHYTPKKRALLNDEKSAYSESEYNSSTSSVFNDEQKQIIRENQERHFKNEASLNESKRIREMDLPVSTEPNEILQATIFAISGKDFVPDDMFADGDLYESQKVTSANTDDSTSVVNM